MSRLRLRSILPKPVTAVETISSPDKLERKIVSLCCLLAAIHVFVFSAAFPYFNNVDEVEHFDLVVNYSQGCIPHGLKPMARETLQYVIYHSPEYMYLPSFFPNGQFPAPTWKARAEDDSRRWNITAEVPNYEVSQPPLYYVQAGLWWRLGKLFGIHGLALLYWLRFLNVVFVTGLAWLGYRTARFIFPDRPLLRLGVPAIIAAISQSALYSIDNDIMSPLCFGWAYFCLLRFWNEETPDVRLGFWTGLSLATVYLAKTTNLPLFILALAVLAIKLSQLLRAGRLRASLPAVGSLALCAGLPVGAWLIEMKCTFGSFTGADDKIVFLGWTQKPIGDWWNHPIFSPGGLWSFLSNLIATFWRGELVWNGGIPTSPIMDALYIVLTISFAVLAFANLHRSKLNRLQFRALWLGVLCCFSSVSFLALLSIQFDFGESPAPSRSFPYLAAGRFILGGLIPFLLFGLYGLDCLLRDLKIKWIHLPVLGCIVLFLLIPEIISDWSVFSSPYNWFHM